MDPAKTNNPPQSPDFFHQDPTITNPPGPFAPKNPEPSTTPPAPFSPVPFTPHPSSPVPENTGFNQNTEQVQSPFMNNSQQPQTPTIPSAGQFIQNPPPPPASPELMQAFTAKDNAVVVSEEVKTPKQKKFPMLLLAFLLIFLTILGGGGYITYAIAYEKIDIGNSKIQTGISQIVMRIPGTPKTANYLITRSVLEQEAVTNNSYDLSLAVVTDQKNDIFNTSRFDFQIKGDVNYEDPKNIDLTSNISWGKDLNFDLVKNGTMLFFKINTIPKAAINLLNINADALNPALNQWVSYDTSTIETEANKFLEEQSSENEKNEEDLPPGEELMKVFNEEIVKYIKIEKAKEDGFNIYKMTLNADDKLVDYIGEKIEKELKSANTADLNVENSFKNTKLSSMIKNLTVEMHVDQKSYLTRKFAVFFDLYPDQKLTSIPDSNVLGDSTSQALSFLKSKISFAMVAKFDKFGEVSNISSPEKSVTFEDYSKKFQTEIYPNLVPQSTIPQTTNEIPIEEYYYPAMNTPAGRNSI